MNKSVDEKISLPFAVVLIGLPASGKSSVGRELASRAGVPFVDIDKEIAAETGRSIADIFAQENGEATFRLLERDMIARHLQGGIAVLSPGGGAFMNEETRARIRAAGAFTVWLRVEDGILLERISRTNKRPTFNLTDKGAMLDRLKAEREPFYAQADLIVACDDRPLRQTVQRVTEALQAALKSRNP